VGKGREKNIGGINSLHVLRNYLRPGESAAILFTAHGIITERGDTLIYGFYSSERSVVRGLIIGCIDASDSEKWRIF
jgi:hypothetical protein